MELHAPAPAWRRITDNLIIGSGAAGLSAALQLAHTGQRTVILTRHDITAGSTEWAQGGLAAVWDPQDSYATHINDTLIAGVGICNDDAVRNLVENAPNAIRRLINLGAQFDRTPHGAYDLHLEGGHSARRILHAEGDASGREVERTLASALLTAATKETNITIEPWTRAIDILTHEGRACGVRVTQDGEVGEWLAGAVILATGGMGQAWSLTTNPTVSTGDGVAMAARAGAQLRGIEFIQFHPTVLAVPRYNGRDVLISEAVRGEGAFIVDAQGRHVMAGKHPQEDLAPRDVVATTMSEHMTEHGYSHLFLDARAFGEYTWATSFPSIRALLHERGIDPVTQLIPVRPGAHYQCGGITAGMDGSTSLSGLFAIGEVANTGVHGANRLASNSLTEALIMGENCAHTILHNPRLPIVEPVARPICPLTDPNALPALRWAMDHYVGVVRNREGLHAAIDTLANLTHTTSFSDDAIDASQLRQACIRLAVAALMRQESRGAHRRSDFPHQGYNTGQ